MSVSIPKRWRPTITRQGPGVYRVAWIGIPICTTPTRSQAKAIAKRLMGLLLPISKSTDVNLAGISAAFYVWLLMASLPESGIRPPVPARAPMVINRPVTMPQRLALGVPVVAAVRAAPPQRLSVIDSPAGPQLVRVPDPTPEDTGPGIGGGGDFGTDWIVAVRDIASQLKGFSFSDALWGFSR